MSVRVLKNANVEMDYTGGIYLVKLLADLGLVIGRSTCRRQRTIAESCLLVSECIEIIFDLTTRKQYFFLKGRKLCV